MSYKIWTINGYGIVSSDIKTTPEKLKKLVELAPKYRKELEEYFVDCGTTFDDFFNNPDEWDPGYYEFPTNGDGYAGNLSAITAFIKEVIQEKENIELFGCSDIEGNEFVMLLPLYPWNNATDEEKALSSEKDLDAIFRKYIEVVAENKEKISVDYQDCTDGG